MLVFSSTASGKSLVTCLIRVFIWIIMNLRALVRKEENATYLCSACYVFLKRAVRICVARLLNFACHLFCPLFVWSMNTMILILPQCVSFDYQRITRAEVDDAMFLEGKFSEILQEQRSVWKCWGEIQKLWNSWRRNSEGSRSLIARTCSNESGPSCNWILTPWFNDSYQKVLACVLSVEWWPIFVFMGIHCWAGAFLVNLYFIDEWRLLTCKQVPSLLQLHTSNVIKAFPGFQKTHTSAPTNTPRVFRGICIYISTVHPVGDPVYATQHPARCLHGECGERAISVAWGSQVKAQWALLRIGRILTFWFSVCDLYKGNPYAFHNLFWATELLTLKVDRGSSTMAEPVIVWKTDKS